MIPIRDITPSKNYPVVNISLIAVNVAVFLLQLGQGEGASLNQFVFTYGLVPARYTNPDISGHFTFGQQAFSLLSFMFLHGGIWHILGNMWSLYIFGDNVEDRLGPLRYLAFYLLCGIASGVTHMVLNLNSNIPTIGASGAIAGVMGAYFILHPGAKILTLIPIVIIPLFVEIPAFIFLGLWFGMQFIGAAGVGIGGGGIAWWAHVGGFVFGIIFLKMFARVPFTGLTQQIRKLTKKKKSRRFQVSKPVSADRGLTRISDMHAVVSITPYEAVNGAKKLVTIQRGIKHRTFKVTIPPGTRRGQKLRLKGQGRRPAGGGRGDVILKVDIL